jgi:superfamily II DNA or RNA helicase
MDLTRPLDLTFDRGTLLLSAPLGPPDPAALPSAADVPGMRWDPRVCALRAPAMRYAEVRAALEQMELPFADHLRSHLATPLRVTLPDLRPYQHDALLAWGLAGRVGTVVLPTGAGKTHVALAAMAELARPTLVLAPTRVLLGQWAIQLREVYAGKVGIYGDGQRSCAPLTVATFESAYRRMDEVGGVFGLVVVDEAHHFASGARAEALEMCAAPARLGLTASPPEEVVERARLARLVGPVVCHSTVAELSGDHLAPLDHMRLFVDLGPQEYEVYRATRRVFSRAFRQFKLQRGCARTWADFIEAAGATHEGREALRAFHLSRQVVSTAAAKLELVGHLLRRHASGRSLVFTADNAAAYALSRRLLIPAITCDIGRAERVAILEGLRAGRLRAVVSSRVLNEGIDLPEASVGIIVGGSGGAREHLQRVGRLLRPRPGKRAQVYEIVARETYEEQHAERRRQALVA